MLFVLLFIRKSSHPFKIEIRYGGILAFLFLKSFREFQSITCFCVRSLEFRFEKGVVKSCRYRLLCICFDLVLSKKSRPHKGGTFSLCDLSMYLCVVIVFVCVCVCVCVCANLSLTSNLSFTKPNRYGMQSVPKFVSRISMFAIILISSSRVGFV